MEKLIYALELLIFCGEENFDSIKKIVLSLFTVLKRFNVTKEVKFSGIDEVSTTKVINTHH